MSSFSCLVCKARPGQNLPGGRTSAVIRAFGLTSVVIGASTTAEAAPTGMSNGREGTGNHLFNSAGAVAVQWPSRRPVPTRIILLTVVFFDSHWLCNGSQLV
ncbi:hypothetical protein BKA91DRAFT_168209 [Yarrowia lipolytica]|nr:hypothetical protein BKA91DRAFT_168209 [Yarrowia lipolytica]RMI96452.1 hypothetical protein BD777DRAFT_153964 [Yarrowia lipolytica]